MNFQQRLTQKLAGFELMSVDDEGEVVSSHHTHTHSRKQQENTADTHIEEERHIQESVFVFTQINEIT